MTKISGIAVTETDIDSVLYMEGERGDGTSVKIPPAVLAGLDFLPEVILDRQTVAAASSIIYNSSLITSAFKAFRIRAVNVVSSTTGQGIGVQLSPNNGSTWRATNYNNTRTIWQTHSTFTNKANGSTAMLNLIPEIFNDTAWTSLGEVLIQDPLNAAVKKLSYGRGVFTGTGTNRYEFVEGGEYGVAEAINAMKILASGGTFSGTFTLTGIR